MAQIDDHQIKITAALLRSQADGAPGHGYHFSIRWLLGNSDHLPGPDDVFAVQIQLRRARRWLAADGNFGAPDEQHELEVRPQKGFMLDPPRELRPLPYLGATHQQWRVATAAPPTVDCTWSGDKPEAQGYGVCNLLSGVQTRSIVERATAFLHERLAAHDRAPGVETARFATLMSAGGDRGKLVDELARALVAARVRGRDIPTLLTNAYTDLLELTSGRSTMPSQLANLHLFGITGAGDPVALTRGWHRAALLALAFREESARDAFDQETRAFDVREHLRVRALQGGELLDFCGTPGARSRMPGSEVLGTGLSVGSFSAADVRSWLNDFAVFTITHRPAHGPAYVQGPMPTVLQAADLQRALDTGSSAPLQPPMSVRVKYDIVQSNAGPSQHETDIGPTLKYTTGDARLQLEIVAPEGASAVLGFNVYGVWEGASPESDRWFSQPDLQPTLRELRRWLITRRYSYQRDLRGPFLTTADRRLTEELEQPGWQPITIRADSLQDLTPPPHGGQAPHGEQPPAGGDAKNPSLPNPSQHTLWSFDLRRGMGSIAELPSRLRNAWAPADPLRIDWTPAQTRDGVELGPDAAHPQRYRFWVASVDAFEQESLPVPVLASDFDAGEASSYLYAPRFRAQLMPVPANSADATEELRIGLSRTATGLRLFWETPFVNDSSSQSTFDATKRMPKEALIANLVLYRRRLQRPTDVRKALRVPPPPPWPIPQWQRVHDQFLDDGWSLLRTWRDVPPPLAGDRWQLDVPLQLKDEGFEYRMAVGMEVAASFRALWFPSILTKSRRVELLGEKDGKYVPTVARVIDAPALSDVATSPIFALPNPREPRAPLTPVGGSRPGYEVRRALPILAPPGMPRDPLLTKLLAAAWISEGVPVESKTWTDTGAELTRSRRAMCVSALHRSIPGSTWHSVEASSDLTFARLLLAREVVANDLDPQSDDHLPPGERDALAQRRHSSIGFRGLVTLRWQYQPLQLPSHPPRPDEAEAARFKISQVRIPQVLDAAVGYGLVSARGDYHADRYLLGQIVVHGEPVVLDQALALGRPLVARLDVDGVEDAAFCPVESLVLDGAGRATLRLRPPDYGYQPPAVLPASANINIYAAHEIGEVEVTDFDAEAQYEITIPVGGGDAEIYAWWVTSVSAQGVDAGSTRRLTALEAFSGSIEPLVPQFLQVGPPTNRDDHSLDAQAPEQRAFIPEQAKADPKLAARLLVAWDGSHADDDTLLVIEREQVLIGQGTLRSPLAFGARTPWEALKAINEAPPGTPLDVADLELLSDWLSGKVMASDPESASTSTTLIRPERRLSAGNGLKRVLVDTAFGPQLRSVFIDYYRNIDDSVSAMNADWKYRYRLRSALDLSPDGSVGSRWRYLLSRATEWSDYAIPEPPRLKVTPRPADAVVVPTQELGPPQVAFKIAAHGTSVRALDGQEVHHRVRVLIQRQITSGLSDRQSFWIDVGRPVYLRWGDSQVVTDDGIERDALDHAPTFTYRVFAQQIVIEEHAGGQKTEHPVRLETPSADAAPEFSVTVAKPSDFGNSEVRLMVPINLF